jgi:hypothetical protein
MQNVTAIPDLPVETGSRSSVFEKTTPELRRKLDRAIVDYNPPGYLALFKKFGLAELGVSYQAFYNYARKLRRRAAARESVQTSLADEQQIVKSLPALLGQFLIDQIMGNDQAAPSAIYRLMLAYTAALKNVVMVQEKSYIFAPRPVAAAQSVPRPLGSAEWPANTGNLKAAHEPRADISPIPQSEIRIPHSPASQISNPEISNSAAVPISPPTPK